jgi:hypothetical protein
VSIIVKRSDPGEAVFIERRRGMAVSGVLVAILLTPALLSSFYRRVKAVCASAS